MKTELLSQRLSHASGAVCFFFLGIFLGTFAFLLTDGDGADSVLPDIPRLASGGEVLPQLLFSRCLLAGFLWLLGISMLALPGTLLFLVWCGCSMAVVVASLTKQQGVRGLPLFLACVFPQVICYLPVMLVFVRWGFQRVKRLHLGGFLVLLLLVSLGAVLEAWVSPKLVLWVSGWLS